MTEKRDPATAIPEDELAAEAVAMESTTVEEVGVPDFDAAESVQTESGETPLLLEPKADAEVQPESHLPVELHALAALALGIVPSAGDPDIRVLVAESPGLRRELAPLLPVADILTSLYQAQPTAPAARPVRIARPDRRASAQDREGASAPARMMSSPRAIVRFSGTTMALIALAVLAVAALLWALALLDRVSTRNDEIDALREQVAQLRGSANASAFTLTPASEEAPDARATIFASAVDRSVLIDVSGLPALEGDEVYQIWFQDARSNEWVLGPAFGVNRQGESVQRLAGDVPGFSRVAISREPGPGSLEPSNPFLLEGTLTDAAG